MAHRGEVHTYEYISVAWAGSSKSGKTQVYNVTNNRSGDLLGRISWYGPWRQYVFMPEPSLYSHGCLEDLADFLGWLRKRKATTLALGG
jgi:hypothetical protein